MKERGSIQNTPPLSGHVFRLVSTGRERVEEHVLLERSHLMDGHQVCLGAVRAADIP